MSGSRVAHLAVLQSQTCTHLGAPLMCEVVSSESSASQCICRVLKLSNSALSRQVYSAQHCPERMNSPEEPVLLSHSCGALLWPITLLTPPGVADPLCHALPGFQSTDNATGAYAVRLN